MQPSSGEVLVEQQVARRETPLQDFVLKDSFYLHYLTLPQAKFAFAEMKDTQEDDEIFFFTKSDLYLLTMARARVKRGGKIALQVIPPPRFLSGGQSFLYKHMPRKP